MKFIHPLKDELFKKKDELKDILDIDTSNETINFVYSKIEVFPVSLFIIFVNFCIKYLLKLIVKLFKYESYTK